MRDFLTESDKAIEVLHDRIWMVVMKVMEDAGKPVADGLGITMHLVDMLPTIPLQLAFHSSTPGLTRFVHQKSMLPSLSLGWIFWISLTCTPLQSNWRVDVLCEEIAKNVCGATEKDKGVDPTWLMSMANVSTIGVKAAEVGAGDGPTSSPCVHLILLAGIVRPGLSLCSIIHKVLDPAHLPLAPVPGQGACQVPAAQAHCNQAPVLSLTLALKLSLTLDLHAGSQAPSEGSGFGGSEHSRSSIT